MWPDLAKFQKSWEHFCGLDRIRQHFESNLANFYPIMAIFRSCRWPNIGKISSHLVTLVVALWLACYLSTHTKAPWGLHGPTVKRLKWTRGLLCSQPVWPDMVIFCFWASIQSRWQQFYYPNRPHCWAIFVKVSKSFIFIVKLFLGNFYIHLAIFYWSHCSQQYIFWDLKYRLTASSDKLHKYRNDEVNKNWQPNG